MTDVAAGRAGFELLEQLDKSDEIWIQRADDASGIAQQIAKDQSLVVVLYGARGSGNTELFKHWVLPALADRWTVTFCTPANLDEPFTPGTVPAIEVWDGFERLLFGEGDNSPLLRRITAARAHRDGLRRIVLIIQEDFLSRLFQLRDQVPEILESVHEIPAMSAASFMEALVRTTSAHGLTLSGKVVSGLTTDVEALRRQGAISPELVVVVAFELIRWSHVEGPSTLEDRRARGGLTALLESHLDFLFENLPDGIDPQIGWAVFHEILAAAPGHTAALADVSYRFDVEPDVPARVVQFLEERATLRAGREGGHEVVPAQLATGAAARAQREDEGVEYLRRLLTQGLRHFAEADALPSERSFRMLHARRSALKLSDDEAKLMLRCSLAYEDAAASGATEHWLRRVADPTAKAEILLGSLFDARAHVRERAARQLRSFNRPEVRKQLHLLALRDASEAVRNEAVESLGVFADPDLEAALILEVNDANSPYRAQAIEALRVYSDPAALEALVTIVRSVDPVQPQEVRAHAIDALARQESPRSLAALLDIALADDDMEDRREATQALSLVKQRESAALVLEGLRAAAKAPRVRSTRSLRQIAAAVSACFACAACAGLNAYIHGFVLLTIRRYWLGIAAIALEAAAITAAFAIDLIDSGTGFIGFLVTMTAGFLVPTGLLLQERRKGVPQNIYRRCMTGVLFALGSVTGFALLHGLPSFLTNRVRRGITITGFQAAGLVIVITAPRLLDQSLWFADPADTTASWAPFASNLFGYTGVALLAMSYAVGVGAVAWETFLWPSRRERQRRLDAAYRQVLKNPEAAALALEYFCGDDPRQVRWGERLVLRYKSIVQDRLCQLWSSAGQPARRRILRTLASRPDPQSIEFLKHAARTAGLRARVRFFTAVWRYRLSVWPKPVLFSVLLSLWVATLYGIVLRELTIRNPMPYLRTLQNVASNEEDRRAAVRELGTFAASTNQQTSQIALASLNMALSSPEVRGSPLLVNDILAALPAKSGLAQIENNIGEVLAAADSTGSQRAIAALARIGSPEAAEVLRAYVENTAAAERDLSNPLADPGPEASARIDRALDALRTMSDQSSAALAAFDRLRESPELTPGLRDAVEEVASGLNPVRWSEYYLELRDYARAIVAANSAKSHPLADEFGDEELLRLVNATARAYALRGLDAFANGRYDQAAADLKTAVQAGGDPALLNDAVDLGLRLGFYFHEEPAADQRAAFESSFEALNSVASVAPAVNEELSLSVGSNLAEAALTAGRYDIALKTASAVEGRLLGRHNPTDADAIEAMKFVRLAAFTLTGDAAQRDAAFNDLTEYHKSRPAHPTGWRYDGTRLYLRSVKLAAPDRDRLFRALRLIEHGA